MVENADYVPGPPPRPTPLAGENFHAVAEKLAKKSEGKRSDVGIEEAERLTTTGLDLAAIRAAAVDHKVFSVGAVRFLLDHIDRLEAAR